MSFISYDGVKDKNQTRKDKKAARRAGHRDEEELPEWFLGACLGATLIIIALVLYQGTMNSQAAASTGTGNTNV